MEKKQLVCSRNSTFKEALEKIDVNAYGVVFIENPDKKIIGILTDGDIRRFLLSGGQLGTLIEGHFNTEFICANSSEKLENIRKKFTYKIKIIPILDDQGKLIDIIKEERRNFFPVTSPDLSGNETKYIMDALESTWISSSGPYIQRFEKEFAEYCGRKYALALSNGTVALHLALVTLGIGPGDEVIVPDLTFAATINAVLHCHATPVIVDIEAETLGIDIKAMEKAITKKTKAIIPVHLYGQPCLIEPIVELAKKHKIAIIEDCAEAHGSLYQKKKIGSFGEISAFSFFANKIITTGEGGMCLMDDETIYNKMKILRDHGMSPEKKYWHDFVGYNYRMTNIQAAMGCAQLERISSILEKRKSVEDTYHQVFSQNKNIKILKNALPQTEKVNWLVCGLVTHKRDELINFLKINHIDTRPFFFPLSAMPVYQAYGNPNEMKVSSKISAMGISFPSDSNLTQKDIMHINEKVLEFYES